MAQIHPSSVVDADAQLGQDVVVGPFCIIGKGVVIGEGTTLLSNVVIESDTEIGNHNIIYPHVCIGTHPQMLGAKQDLETGGLVIGDNNVFREQVTVHCSLTPGKHTRIGNDNLFMVSSHVGHDCVIEDKVVLTNLVQLAGHCKLETGAWLSGLVGVHQFVTIGCWSYTAGHTSVIRDIPPFLAVSGSYPTLIRGVNSRGFNRAGLTDDQKTAIRRAYQCLYRNKNGTLLSNAKLLAQQDGLDENVRAMIEFIEKSSQHRFGRYLELYRH
jgi:UDP-N-acetylglucosamine acyltransferase